MKVITNLDSILKSREITLLVKVHITMTTGKTIALTIWTSMGKVMSLLFNMLSRFVIAFLLKVMHHLISWLQSLSAVILELRKIKSPTVSTYFPSICHEVMGLDAMILGSIKIHLLCDNFLEGGRTDSKKEICRIF